MNVESTTKAPKDKNCPYCGQAFTSSSLGRHLDLYIKDKNPKAPDGIHNVDEIRKIRGGITRRQPRGGARRDASAPRNSTAGSRRSPDGSDTESIATRSAGTLEEAHFARDLTEALAPCGSRIKTTGVINDIPDAGDETNGADATSKSNTQRPSNRQVMKASLDAKQRFQDALDRAKAAELALREIISSWRAAKQQINVNSMPFDFDPLSLDFPALCLECLEPPPTLFSLTPYPTSTSWFITPPGEQQKDALHHYFQSKFAKWKINCAATTKDRAEDLSFPGSQAALRQETASQLLNKSDKAAETLERQVIDHLTTAFRVWEQLPQHRQQELWTLELARSVARKRELVSDLKETQHSLKQENTNLKSQIDNLNRLQQPREFKIIPPMTLKVDEKMVDLWTEAGVPGHRGTGLNTEDRHSDLNKVIAGAIDRWKNVITSARAASGMNTQRSLDPSSGALRTPISANQPLTPVVQTQQNLQGARLQYDQASPNNSHKAPSSAPRQTSVSSAGPTTTTMSEAMTSATSTPAQSPPDDSDDEVDADAEDDEDADADADMEMEGGSEYLSTANPIHHHSMPQMSQQHQVQQSHPIHIGRPTDRQMIPAGQSPYSQRGGSYGGAGVLPSQQMHQAFNHQLQSLNHHLSQGHLDWVNR